MGSAVFPHESISLLCGKAGFYAVQGFDLESKGALHLAPEDSGINTPRTEIPGCASEVSSPWLPELFRDRLPDSVL